MLNLLLISLLVASAAGAPRSKGQQLQHSVVAQSGGSYQYNPNAATPQNVQANYIGTFRQNDAAIVPVPLSKTPQPQSPGATFQVDPNTLQVTRVDQPQVATGQPNFQQNQNFINPGPQNQFTGQPAAQQYFPSPVGNQIIGQQNSQRQQQTFSQHNIINPVAQNQYTAQPAAQQPFPAPAGQQNFQTQPTLNNYPTNQGIPNLYHNPPIHNAVPQDNQFGTGPGRNNLVPKATGASLSESPAAELAKRLIGNPPGGSLLIGSIPPIFPLEKRLISNYTKLRPVVTDTFRCDKNIIPNYVGYGYYGDVANECQIFHICLPWKELFPKTFAEEVTYQFSFICPNQTVFSQDTMTCNWKSEALPCEASPELYWMNDNFFRKVPAESGYGTRYASINEKLTPLPIVYDYDDFNPVTP